jgi:hypothetical protein
MPTEQGGGVTWTGYLMYPFNSVQKIRSQNAIKHAKRNPPRFSHNPKYPLSKEFQNDWASMIPPKGIYRNPYRIIDKKIFNKKYIIVLNASRNNADKSELSLF